MRVHRSNHPSNVAPLKKVSRLAKDPPRGETILDALSFTE